MAVPDYMVDQNEDRIKAQGFTFRDFSPAQILGELRMRDIRIKYHGIENEKRLSRGFSTIVDGVPQLGERTRW